jgi:hypothetical protein
VQKLPLRRSPEYKSRVRTYALGLADRYRPEIADAFLTRVKQAEALVADNNLAGTDAPYLLAGHHVVLKELYFNSGPATYCLIYMVTDEYVGLLSLWHGEGSRKSGGLRRIWKHG